jgi:rhodanese-related sulfurtransferase
MKPKELAKKIKTGQTPFVVDVRSGFEYRSGHIPGAVHVPFLGIFFKLSALPKDKRAKLVLTCEHGPRARLALSLLRIAGFQDLELLEGHMSAWRQGKLPMER